MVAVMHTARPVAEMLRMIRATIRHLTSIAVQGEPAPYWTDYLREAHKRAD